MWKMIKYFILWTIFWGPLIQLNAQREIEGLNVNIHGYLFVANGGLFFQPFEPNVAPDFLQSLNKASFFIGEGNLDYYSKAIKGVGSKLVVENYSKNITKTNSEIDLYDTIYYFRCSIEIYLDLFAQIPPHIRKTGFSFFYNDSLIYYGNFFVNNQILKINPDDTNILIQLYNSYRNQSLGMPYWLKELYDKRVLKRKKH